MVMNLKKIIADTIGNRVVKIVPMGGGETTMTIRLLLEDDRQFIAKLTKPGMTDTTPYEELMLNRLRENTGVPTPEIIFTREDLLVMEYVDNDKGGLSKAAEADAGRLLAQLHHAPADYFGFEVDTVVGLIQQPNEVRMSWTQFFAEQRLMYGAKMSVDVGNMPARFLGRIEKLIENLPNFIPQDVRPSLLHGALMRQNILCKGDKVVAFIDPALYYGHSEMDIAFLSMFGKLSDEFYASYNEVTTIDKEFYSERKWVYLIWPMLIQIRLHGGNYVKHLDGILTKLGV